MPDRRAELFQLLAEIPPPKATHESSKLEAEEEFSPSKPHQQPTIHRGEKVGRNDPCPCGSGKKYKKCCLH